MRFCLSSFTRPCSRGLVDGVEGFTVEGARKDGRVVGQAALFVAACCGGV